MNKFQNFIAKLFKIERDADFPVAVKTAAAQAVLAERMEMISELKSQLADAGSVLSNIRTFNHGEYLTYSERNVIGIEETFETLSAESFASVIRTAILSIQDDYESGATFERYVSEHLLLDTDNNRAVVRDIMKRSEELGTLRMSSWQGALSNIPGSSIFDGDVEGLHACGNVACLGGHIRVSPYFNSIVNFRPNESAPCLVLDGLPYLRPDQTVAILLKMPVWLASLMIFCHCDSGNKHVLYGVEWQKVQPSHILAFMDRLESESFDSILEDVKQRIY